MLHCIFRKIYSNTRILRLTVLHFVFIGSSYYLGFYRHIHRQNASIIILTTESQPVSYSIEIPGIGYYHNGTVTANNEDFLDLPRTAIVLSRGDQYKGIHFKASSDRVTVVGQYLRPTGSSVDTFLSIPTMSLCTEQYVYFGITVADASSHNSKVLIVGTENNTMLNLAVTQHVTIRVDDTNIVLNNSIEYPLVINRFQTVLVESTGDLTGSKIVTNKPVSVLCGHECVKIPPNVGGCDFLIEQVPPTIYWGRVHYIVPIATRIEYTIKVLAAYDSTNVCIYCNGTRRPDYTINGGEFFTCLFSLQEYCVINSSKEVLVAQFSHGQYSGFVGDPLMTLVPPITQYMNEFSFSTLRSSSNLGYKHFVNIMVLAQYYQPDMIYVISRGMNEALNEQEWIPVEVNNVTEAYATTVNVSEGAVKIIHTDTTALLTTIVYGLANHEGYGNPGGFNSYAGTYAIKQLLFFLLYSNLCECM